MALEAFIDESADDQSYVLAGFVSTVEKWALFSIDFADALAAEPRIKYFKMNEVRKTSGGEFKGLCAQKREDKLLRLVIPINIHTESDFSCSVSVKAFNAILAPILPERYKYPWLWLFHGIITAICSYEQIAGEGKIIDFTFDEQKQFLGKALRLYEELKRHPPFSEYSHLVGRIVPGKDHEVLPLQAADMLAGQIRLFRAALPSQEFSPCTKALKSTGRISYNFSMSSPQLLKIARSITNWSGGWPVS
jgi:hypothetical protein